MNEILERNSMNYLLEGLSNILMANGIKRYKFFRSLMYDYGIMIKMNFVRNFSAVIRTVHRKH